MFFVLGTSIATGWVVSRLYLNADASGGVHFKLSPVIGSKGVSSACGSTGIGSLLACGG